MAQRVAVGIAGTGSYAPPVVMTNHDLEKLVDTSDEWIVQRTGIKERHYAEASQATSDLCLEAARQALDSAKLKPTELDLIVVGTLTPDFLLPSCAALLQAKLGAVNAGAFDVNAACTGFLTALHTGESFIAAGRAKKVLVLGAETLSRFLNMQDRSSCILFGDGAGAMVLAPHAECGRGEILRSTLGADGTGYEFIHMRGGGSRVPPTAESVARGDHFITLRGREVFRFAVLRMAELIEKMSEGFPREEVSLVVPHQVNARIIEAALERLDWPMDKCFVNIDKYGNTSAATVPMAFHEALAQGRIEEGKLVVFCAFGAGLTWGGTLLRW
jgi:3-oxoacyl-[acyl-carrier-protein] synthase-3